MQLDYHISGVVSITFKLGDLSHCQLKTFIWDPDFFNPLCPRIGGSTPSSLICVYLCKYTNKRTEKNYFPKSNFRKGQYVFFPLRLSCFAENRRAGVNSFLRPPFLLVEIPVVCMLIISRVYYKKKLMSYNAL